MRRMILVLLVLLAVSGVLFAQQSFGDRLGIGIILGEPTGLSLKMWTGDRGAFDAAVAWSFTGSAVYIHIDYLMHVLPSSPRTPGSLSVYLGLGGTLLVAGGVQVGLRMPIGINYLFARFPIGIFAELAPGVLLTPSTAFRLGGGAGIHFYL